MDHSNNVRWADEPRHRTWSRTSLATWSIRVASASEEPPNFITTRRVSDDGAVAGLASSGVVAAIVDHPAPYPPMGMSIATVRKRRTPPRPRGGDDTEVGCAGACANAAAAPTPAPMQGHATAVRATRPSAVAIERPLGSAIACKFEQF